MSLYAISLTIETTSKIQSWEIQLSGAQFFTGAYFGIHSGPGIALKHFQSYISLIINELNNKL